MKWCHWIYTILEARRILRAGSHINLSVLPNETLSVSLCREIDNAFGARGGWGGGGLVARSGTEFTWSPQLRNLAEWDWVPIFLQNKYGGECRHGRTMGFCSVLSFLASKRKEKVFVYFFNGIFGHREAWCMNSSWVTSLFVIRHLVKFSYF